jgi:hypothetical protein
LYVSVATNGQLASTSPVGVLPANWIVVGADLNGWIFLRNTVTGEVRVWVLQVGSAQCAAALPPIETRGAGSECGPGPTIPMTADLGSMPSNWSICGIGDFDGDGYSDILWRDNQGDVRIWLLGTTPQDIREDNTGNLKAWFMQGTTVAKTQTLANFGLNWKVQSLNDQ